MANINQSIEIWKKRLLDLGKRNRLINYRETKRSNIKITFPQMEILYERLVEKEEVLAFPLTSEEYEEDETENSQENITSYGDLGTDRSVKEQQKTLASLRSKAKTALEEQGVNILYLSFGFLEWMESSDSGRQLVSPIVLVPVKLTLEFITSPFMLSLHEDEIVINPTLAYRLESDFGFTFPSFEENENDIGDYLRRINTLIRKNGWGVSYEVSLGLLSFRKINMYRDIDRNIEKIKVHPIIKALGGDTNEIVSLSEEYNNFDHDRNTKPIDIYQVVDADSSQQDAILYSKKGVSFVLQGPPGTGKSQTITNIIAEALADGKRVLFVSEKTAALDVVLKRLTQVGLSDFCLDLHSHKANKKQVLEDLGRMLNLSRIRLQDDALNQLELLKTYRDQLNQYTSELHTTISPLKKTIYEINGRLAKLRAIPDIVFSIENVRGTTREKFNQYQFALREFSATLGKLHEDYSANPWRNSNVPVVTHELRHNVETYVGRMLPEVEALAREIEITIDTFGLEQMATLEAIGEITEILGVVSRSPKVPVHWAYSEDISSLLEQAESYSRLKAEYYALLEDLSRRHEHAWFTLPATQIQSNYTTLVKEARRLTNAATYPTEADIIDHLPMLLDQIRRTLDVFETIEKIYKTAEGLLGVNEIQVIGDVVSIKDLFERILATPKPASDWFNPERFKMAKRLFEEARKNYTDLEAETNQIISRFDAEILSLDYAPILKRFKTEYTSIFKLVKKNYWADKKIIKSLSNEIGLKIDDNGIIQILNQLKFIHDKRAWIADNEELMTSMLGGNYFNKYTDWSNLEEAFTNFERITAFFGGSEIPEKTKEILLSGGSNLDKIRADYNQLQAIWSSGIVDAVGQIMPLSKSISDIEFDSFWKVLKIFYSRFKPIG